MTEANGAGENGDDDLSVVYDLAPACTAEDVSVGERYHATVNGVVDYGVFVDVSDEVSGLIHESELDRAYDVGDKLIAQLETIRDNGDMAFVPGEPEEYRTVAVDADPDQLRDRIDDLEPADTSVVEGKIVQVKQTGGPTLFHVRDGTGVIPAAAFEEAGVRAYPDVEIGDAVRIKGIVERHDGSRQLEVNSLTVLDGDEAEAVTERLETAVEEWAEPHDVEPLIEWDAMQPLLEELEGVARLLRSAVIEGRPIRVRHHADGDGMCAAVPVEYALERFIGEVHEDADAPRHLFRRLPSKAPFYEMEDATRDLNFALEDRARHGQKLPLLLMLDNGSTEEDVPGYRNLAHYDIPIVVIDHHHPDPDAVQDLVAEHVNPYLHGEDYRITTGMLCVELARMIDPSITDELRHVPAVAGISDRSSATAMADYLELAREAGYDEDDLKAIGEALDYEAHWLKYDPGRNLIDDVLDVGSDDPDRHRDLVAFLSERSTEAVDRQLDAALPHVEEEALDNGARLFLLDVENHAHRFTYPAPGKTTGAVHDRMVAETGDPVITIGYGPDFAVLRSDGVRLDIPGMVADLSAEIEGGGVGGGGHLVVGSINFVQGMRDEVLDALIEKMGDAEIDEAIGSATAAAE